MVVKRCTENITDWRHTHHDPSSCSTLSTKDDEKSPTIVVKRYTAVG